MNELKFFRHFPSEYLLDDKVMALTAAQEGYLHRLWDLAWLRGGTLPNDAETLLRMVGKGIGIDDLNHLLRAFFELDVENKQWVSPRLRDQAREDLETLLKRVKNLTKARKAKAEKMLSALNHESTDETSFKVSTPDQTRPDQSVVKKASSKTKLGTQDGVGGVGEGGPETNGNGNGNGDHPTTAVTWLTPFFETYQRHRGHVAPSRLAKAIAPLRKVEPDRLAERDRKILRSLEFWASGVVDGSKYVTTVERWAEQWVRFLGKPWSFSDWCLHYGPRDANSDEERRAAYERYLDEDHRP